MKFKSWQRATLILGLTILVSPSAPAWGKPEPVSLHVFVEQQHGRITLIGLASDRGTIIHNDRGLLDAVVYDNGYADLYTYFDSDHVIEVTRENDKGEVESVFRFDFTGAYATKWDANSDEVIRRTFDLGEAFYDRLVATAFKQPRRKTEAGSGSASFSFTSNCVCRYGNDTSCEGWSDKDQCKTNQTCGTQDEHMCVWRGNIF